MTEILHDPLMEVNKKIAELEGSLESLRISKEKLDKCQHIWNEPVHFPSAVKIINNGFVYQNLYHSNLYNDAIIHDEYWTRRCSICRRSEKTTKHEMKKIPKFD